ncbi:MAG: ATP-binding cassette domain-containing protein [Gammaproteobacteria bacterium]|nr:ATP-binding cassette domain-containing protein [Gammaproteobacteria bacterium]
MPAQSSAPPRLELRGIRKVFATVVANDGIDLAVQPGQIHALLGENGAGKSTLVKIVDGLLQADAGEIRWNGRPVTVRGPRAARALGIGMVFQHFSLFEALSVAENIALGLDRAIPMRQLGARISALAGRYRLSMEPERAVHTLSMGERQRVEILRCLLRDTQLLILDEPTSVLTPQEAEQLFVTLRQLAEEGCSILYISHKLHEIKALCSHATILRAGKVAGQCDPRTQSSASMARMMVGAALAAPERKSPERGPPVLTVNGLSTASDDRFGVNLADIHLQLHAGEIMGIAGVAGNGQSELVKALSGEHPATTPEVVRIGGVAAGRLGPRGRRRLGLACIPEDRQGQGAVPPLSLVRNTLLTAAASQGFTQSGFIRAGRLAGAAQATVHAHDVRCAGPWAAANSLSGGNLQKFITGRELGKRPRILIAAQPTWGVDAGAATAIHQALIDLAAGGAGVLIVSQELDELMALCDRIAVIYAGRLSEASPTQTLNATIIGLRMAGQAPAAEQPAGERSAAQKSSHAAQH